MKRRIFTMMMMVVAMLVTTSAVAQDNATSVQRMASHTYTVNPSQGNGSFTYAWSIETGGTTTDVSGDTDNSITVVWDGSPGTYTITVQGTDGNNCLSEEVTLDVTIEVPTVEFTASNLTGSTCSYLGTDDASGNSGVASANDILEYEVEFSGGDPDFTLTYDVYDITSGGTANAGGTLVKDDETTTITALTGQTLNLNIDSDFENSTASDKTYAIRIVSATDSDGTTVDAGTDFYATVTIYSKPVVTFP